jgi:hypothetical protein
MDLKCLPKQICASAKVRKVEGNGKKMENSWRENIKEKLRKGGERRIGRCGGREMPTLSRQKMDLNFEFEKIWECEGIFCLKKLQVCCFVCFCNCQKERIQNCAMKVTEQNQMPPANICYFFFNFVWALRTGPKMKQVHGSLLLQQMILIG